MIAHELKTPLTQIKGCAQLLQRRQVYQQWAVEVIITTADQLNQRLDELLLALALEEDAWPLQRTPINLATLVQLRAHTRQATTAEHRLVIEAPDGPLTLWLDERGLTRVIDHLLANAIAYAPAGGEVRIVIERRDDAARVAIVDHGVGIPAEETARVFERFYRVDDPAVSGRQGLGLGLYVSQLLVRAHGGEIAVESSIRGQGSTFVMQLPLHAPPAGAN